jgi:hypothetical protein
VGEFLHGEGSVFQPCPGHYRDLGALTNFAPKETYQRWMSVRRPEPPVVPFPWRSLEDIPARLAELESQAISAAQCRGGRRKPRPLPDV